MAFASSPPQRPRQGGASLKPPVMSFAELLPTREDPGSPIILKGRGSTLAAMRKVEPLPFTGDVWGLLVGAAVMELKRRRRAAARTPRCVGE